MIFGIGNLIEDRTFRESKVECFWDNESIATLFIDKAENHPSRSNNIGASNTTGLEGASDTNVRLEFPSSNFTKPNNTLNEVVNPGFYIRPDAKTLQILNVFVMVINAVYTLFRSYPLGDEIRQFTFIKTKPEWDVAMILTSNYERIRARPPHFEIRFAIETVRRLPAFLLHQRRFAETDFSVVVDDVRVGRGLMFQGQDPYRAIKAVGTA